MLTVLDLVKTKAKAVAGCASHKGLLTVSYTAEDRREQSHAPQPFYKGPDPIHEALPS
jgi:hypothetical protein